MSSWAGKPLQGMCSRLLQAEGAAGGENDSRYLKVTGALCPRQTAPAPVPGSLLRWSRPRMAVAAEQGSWVLPSSAQQQRWLLGRQGLLTPQVGPSLSRGALHMDRWHHVLLGTADLMAYTGGDTQNRGNGAAGVVPTFPPGPGPGSALPSEMWRS